MPSFNDMKQLAITPNEFATLSQAQKEMPGVSINQGELMLMQNADNDGYHVYVGANGGIQNFSVDTNGNAANGLNLQQILQENEIRQLDFANFKRKIKEQENFLASQGQGLPAPLTPEAVQAMDLPSALIRIDLPPPPQNFIPTNLSYIELPDETPTRSISPNQNNVTVSEDKKEIDLDATSWTHIAAENEKPLTVLEEADISVRFANTYDKLKASFLSENPEFSKTAEGAIVKGNPPQELSGEDLDKFAKFYNANVQKFGNVEFRGSGFDPKFSNLDPAQMNVVQNAQASKMQMETTNETPKPSTKNKEQTPSPSPTPTPESSQQPSPKELKKAIKESTKRVKELMEGIEDTKNSIKQLDSQIEATRDQGIMGMIKREYLAQQRWKQAESLEEQENELLKESKKLFDLKHPQHADPAPQKSQQTQTSANEETPVLNQSTTNPNTAVKIPEPIANLAEKEFDNKLTRPEPSVYQAIPVQAVNSSTTKPMSYGALAPEVPNTQDDGIIKPTRPVPSLYQALPAHAANSPAAKEMSYGSLAPEEDLKVQDAPAVPSIDDETQSTGYNVMPSSESTVINSSSTRPVFENPKPKGYSNLDLEEAEQKEISAIKEDVVPYSTVTYETLLPDKLQYASLSAEDVKQEGGYQSLPANRPDNTPHYARLPTQEIDKAIIAKPNELNDEKVMSCLTTLEQIDNNKPNTQRDMSIVGKLTQQQNQQPEQNMENVNMQQPGSTKVQ